MSIYGQGDEKTAGTPPAGKRLRIQLLSPPTFDEEHPAWLWADVSESDDGLVVAFVNEFVKPGKGWVVVLEGRRYTVESVKDGRLVCI